MFQGKASAKLSQKMKIINACITDNSDDRGDVSDTGDIERDLEIMETNELEARIEDATEISSPIKSISVEIAGEGIGGDTLPDTVPNISLMINDPLGEDKSDLFSASGPPETVVQSTGAQLTLPFK